MPRPHRFPCATKRLEDLRTPETDAAVDPTAEDLQPSDFYDDIQLTIIVQVSEQQVSTRPASDCIAPDVLLPVRVNAAVRLVAAAQIGPATRDALVTARAMAEAALRASWRGLR